jgi:ADP-L-glycero-D-manno-heptose 6-epimerase
MIVVTGASGFIGSALIHQLNAKGYSSIIAVDKFDSEIKNRNTHSLSIVSKIDRDVFPDWFLKNGTVVDFVFHLGARTDTSERDEDLLRRLNTEYTKKLWHLCVKFSKPFVYASSAATYGDGKNGFNDHEPSIASLCPLNPYGRSKHLFDSWCLNEIEKPPFWAGLKFFNVYGPNEYHKGRMASVVFHAYHQLQQTKSIKLFKSHIPQYGDGGQKRDFIYVKDVLKILEFLMLTQRHSGIYNIGTAVPSTFVELAKSIFQASGEPENIAFIDMPEDIRTSYQYYTCASIEKLRSIGYTDNLYSIQEGVADYVKTYLKRNMHIHLNTI